jgi:succinate dehydrogenase / fumarate reductase flavoprotein subunit
MQGLADGYFVLPYTIGDYLAQAKMEKIDAAHPACRAVETEAGERVARLLNNGGSRTVDSFHRELGALMWNRCGMARTAEGLREALAAIPPLRAQFHAQVKVVGRGEDVNQSLEKAGRVADFFELAELMCRDALVREESCGGHFREEHQTPDGEARRDDARFCHVAAWEWQGAGNDPVRHVEPLVFENVHLTQRSYK